MHIINSGNLPVKFTGIVSTSTKPDHSRGFLQTTGLTASLYLVSGSKSSMVKNGFEVVAYWNFSPLVLYLKFSCI